MSEQMFDLTITATGEVRDADGNLLSAEPVEAHIAVPESHLEAMGLTDDEIKQIKEQQT